MKKGQIKLFESIAVLMVFVFIVAIGLRFYGNVQRQALLDARNEFTQLDALKSSLILSNLPEMQCSVEGFGQTSCLDWYKVQAWDRLMNDPDNLAYFDYYLPILGESEIVVDVIYPASQTFVVYNASRPNTSFDQISFPILVYDPLGDRNHFAMLRIKTFYS